jgi:hypothetical protein
MSLHETEHNKETRDNPSPSSSPFAKGRGKLAGGREVFPGSAHKNAATISPLRVVARGFKRKRNYFKEVMN